MSIITTYNEKILEEVLRSFLQDGTIPTADMLLEAYETYVANHPDMTKPFILDEDHTVEEYEDSSAEAYNAFFQRALSDLEALYQETWDRTADGMNTFDRWRIELSMLSGRLLDLERRIDALLLLRGDTAGYFSFVEDNFVDLSKVDQTETTCRVDIVNHMVTIGEDIDSIVKVNLNSIQPSDATFTVLTRDKIVLSKEAPQSSVKYAVEDLAHSWQHRVFTQLPSLVITGELKVKLGVDPVEVSRITMDLHSSNTNGAMIIVCMYSLDNYNWFNAPCENYTQSVDDKAVFVFQPTQARWIKFIMTKTGADDVEDGLYVYEFGASSIRFFNCLGYNTEDGNVFVSEEMSALDTDGNKVLFNKVALQACEILPDDTNIQYSIQVSNDSGSSDFMRIDPFNRKEPVASTVLELDRILETEVESLTFVAKAIPEVGAYFASYGDVLKSGLVYALGTDISTLYKIAAEESSRIVEDRMILYRNKGDNGGVSNETYRNVRGTPRGWVYDSTRTYLITFITINNPEGFWIDLGNSSAVLDGSTITNKVLISPGLHTFKTHIKNIVSLPDDYIPYTTEALLAIDDPLYPYNHKLLIEGVPYDSAYTEEKKYLGVDIYCESVATRVSIFDLMNNTAEDDFSKFATDLLSDGSRIVLIRLAETADDQFNERSTLSYVTDEDMFDTIRIRAELLTNAQAGNITPVLTAYRIKLGA